MCAEKRLRAGVKVRAILRPRKPVALVGVNDINHAPVVPFDSRDNLLRFSLLDPRIIGALPNKQRADDAIGRVQRGRLPYQLVILGIIHIAQADVENREHRFPIRRNRMDEGLKVRWADDVNGTGENVRRERDRRQGAIATVRAAHDADLLRVGIAFLHGPIDRVNQVVVHLEPPLLVAGIEEAFPVTGGAAEIGLQHSIPTIGQPLRVTIKSPFVASPGSAVGEQHHWEVLGRHSHRQGQIAVDLQPVTGGDDYCFHFGQGQPVEFGPRGE